MKIGEFCEINKYTYSLSEHWDYINYLDTGNITDNRIAEIQYFVTALDEIPSRARRKVNKNNIVYSTVRPNQLHYGIITAPLNNMLVSTGFAVVAVDECVADPFYIYYYLTQRNVVASLQAIGEQSTSAYPSIKPADIEEIEIDLPPLDKQKIIGRILRSIEEKIYINSEINDNLAA